MSESAYQTKLESREMLYTDRVDNTCPWKCCGTFINKGKRHRKRNNWHRTLRTREKRNWQSEEF